MQTFRFVLFVIYILVLPTLPLGILWQDTGIIVGLSLSSFLLIYLRTHGTAQISTRLRALKLSGSEQPLLFQLVAEHSRRAQIPQPMVWIIPTRSLNIGTFGFSPKEGSLVITEGLLKTLDREELSALIALQIVNLSSREFISASWLSEVLELIQFLVSRPVRWSGSGGSRGTPFYVFIRQIVFYPLALLPSHLLKPVRPRTTADSLGARLSKNPRALSEALRKIEASFHRNPHLTPFSLRHLFLVHTDSPDPLLRSLFPADSLLPRIEKLETTGAFT